MTSLGNMSSVSIIGNELGSIFDESLQLFAQRPEWKGHTGAYFCWADAKWGNPEVVLAVGDVPCDKAEKYLALCIEKAKRLALHPAHLSSWESRERTENHWGGAVRGNYIYSLSGLPELGDEAVMLSLVLALQPESGALAEAIAARSGNPYFAPLCEFLNRRK